MTTMEPLLVVDRVSKSFGKLKAVAEVSFSVGKGEIYGIAGPNGAGKTTLFNVISAVPFHADAGRIVFKGRPIHSTAPHKINHLGLARTFQRETVFETLSVLENVLVAAAFGQPQNRDTPRRRALAMLDSVGLADFQNQEARHLSLFQKKRLMLASALVTEPELLLLDEPAAGLNQLEVGQSLELFQALNRQGVTMILIEHVLPLLLALSHRVMILDHGQKLCEDQPDKVVENQAVIDLSGLVLGSLYALMSTGLSLIWGTVRMFNFAHGSLVMLGAYLAWTFGGSWGLDLGKWTGLCLACGAMFLIGILIERILVRPFIKRPNAVMMVLITTLAASSFLDNSAQLVWGPRMKRLPPLLDGDVNLLGSAISAHELMIMELCEAFLSACTSF